MLSIKTLKKNSMEIDKAERQKQKELLNLSGEFRVASELIRRGFYALLLMEIAKQLIYSFLIH